MKPYVIPDLRTGYLEVVEYVKSHGREVWPRGYKTWEVEDACFEVEDTTKLLPMCVGRGTRPEIGAAEALLLCSGLASPSLLGSVSGAFNRFVDGGVQHGAYGPRVRPQLETVVRRLQDDPDTRQAILQIWDPLYDSVDTRDLPCTLGFGFRIRDGSLHMSTTMRSQDVWLGLAYDGFFFGQLGWSIADVLGVDLASWRHHVYSLHLYDRNADDTDKLHAPHGQYDEPLGFGVGTERSYAEVRERAELIYNRALDADVASQSERWYMSVLDPFDRLVARANFSS